MKLFGQLTWYNEFVMNNDEGKKLEHIILKYSYNNIYNIKIFKLVIKV